MSRLTFTVTIDFVDDDELDNCAGPVEDGLNEYLASVVSDNPFITDYSITEE